MGNFILILDVLWWLFKSEWYKFLFLVAGYRCSVIKLTLSNWRFIFVLLSIDKSWHLGRILGVLVKWFLPLPLGLGQKTSGRHRWFGGKRRRGWRKAELRNRRNRRWERLDLVSQSRFHFKGWERKGRPGKLASFSQENELQRCFRVGMDGRTGGCHYLRKCWGLLLRNWADGQSDMRRSFDWILADLI